MLLVRVLWAETLKVKRTGALWVAVATPLSVVLLNCIMVAVLPGNLARSATPWAALQRLTFGLWAVLMLPLFVALASALLAGLEHRENQWKRILVLPVSRWAIYIGKLLIAISLVYAATLLVAFGICVGGLLLPRVQPALRLAPPVPWSLIFVTALEVGSLAFWFLTLQHWVSLRWRSFTVSFCVGMVAMVVGFVLINAGEWGRFYPWAMPSAAVMKGSIPVELVLAVCWICGIVSAAAGCYDFCRREME